MSGSEQGCFRLYDVYYCDVSFRIINRKCNSQFWEHLHKGWGKFSSEEAPETTYSQCLCNVDLRIWKSPNNKLLLADSLLPLAFQVARTLNQMDEKWEILSKFWVENLAYVATLCQGNNHAQPLCKGGEFLTHVWFLL